MENINTCTCIWIINSSVGQSLWKIDIHCGIVKVPAILHIMTTCMLQLIIFRCLSSSKTGINALYNMIMILSIPVASAPTNLMAVQKDLTSIRISWSPPTPLGYTTGYRIYYSDGNVSDIVDVSGGSTNNYLLTDLLTAATYTISIVGTFQHLPSERVETMITLCKSKWLNKSIQFLPHFILYL